MRELDIVTNASNLTKLYQFCLHPSAMGQRHNWRLHCELHGERTMLLHLWNRNDYRVPNIMGNSGTYGRMFEVHNTHEPNGAHPMLSGHFRTVGYRLAGMNFAVRRQIDALLPDWNGPAVFPNAKRISKPKVTRHEDFTMIYTGGQPVTGRTIELKTSQSSIPDYRIHEEWIDHIATCWFSRVPLIMCGRYNDEGNFIRVDSFDLDKGGVVKAWINESRRPLERMMHLLKLMRETIRQSKKGRLAFVRNDEPFVAVHELDQGNVSLLPDDVSKMLQ